MSCLGYMKEKLVLKRRKSIVLNSAGSNTVKHIVVLMVSRAHPHFLFSDDGLLDVNEIDPIGRHLSHSAKNRLGHSSYRYSSFRVRLFILFCSPSSHVGEGTLRDEPNQWLPRLTGVSSQ